MMTDSLPSASLSVNTSASLLLRVKARDGEAWRRLAYLYGPMVYRWARKAGLQATDAQDVVQNVFLAMSSDIDRFRRSQPGDSFRGWLWTICRHKVLDYYRDRQHQALTVAGGSVEEALARIAPGEREADEEREDRCRLRHRALALMRDQFEKHVWQAFLRVVVHGDRPADVARDLRVSVATVYRAKFRVLTRLRSELEGL